MRHLNAMRKKNKAIEENSQRVFFNTAEAAEFLDISMSLMYKLSSNQAITKYKRGGKVYFKKEDLIRYIEQGRIDGLDSIQDSVHDTLKLISRKGDVK